MNLLILLVTSFLGLTLIAGIFGVKENRRVKKVNKRREENEVKRNIRLQQKRDQFNAFKRLVETYERDCSECYENDYDQYIECHPGDFKGEQRYNHNFDLKAPCNMCKRNSEPSYQEAYDRLDKPIQNLRVQLSDFTAGEVMGLFSL